MKYYKRISFINPHYPCKVGIIYPENFQQGHYRAVSEAVKAYPEHWQEVSESEYLLQEARERYPVGTVFIPAHVNKGTARVVGNHRFENLNDKNCKTIIVSAENAIWIPCVYYAPLKIWAEIISKPEIKMEKEFILPLRYSIRGGQELQNSNFRNLLNINPNGWWGDSEANYYHFNGTIFDDYTCYKKPNYQEITFEQFKKYVLKENPMKKEIIGYKLVKPEYKEAALKISNTVTNWENSLMPYDVSIRQTGYIKKLTEAGVLNLWFEAVYKEEDKFKPGDWVRWTGVGAVTAKIHKRTRDYNGKQCYVLDVNGNLETHDSCSVEYLRLATPEEIKAAQKPVVSIKGYKAEIFEDKVKFGCQEYSKEFILTLRKCIESNGFDFSFNGKSFVWEIEEIAKYYEQNS